MPADAWNLLTVDRGAGWRLLRDAGPVLRDGEGTYYITQRDEVLAALRDPMLISEPGYPTPSGERKSSPELMRMFEEMFSPRKSRELAAKLRDAISAHIDRAVAAGGCDAAGLTAQLAADTFEVLCALSPADVADAETVAGLAEVVKRRRANPGDDVLSQMVLRNSDDDAVGIAVRFWQGLQGVWSTSANSVLLLARQPDLADELRGRPELIPGFVEEVVRLESVIPWYDRQAIEPIMIAGVAVPAGAMVNLCLAAIHRDGSDEMSTDNVALGRRGHQHWGFGVGSHRCRGAHLIREILRVFVTEWVTRVPRCELPADYQPVIAFPTWSVCQLPLRFAPK